MLFFWEIVLWVVGITILIFLWVVVYDYFFQKDNAVKSNYPWVGRFRYLFHELRPLLRQYFWDDNAFTPRVVIDRILHVSSWKSWYFAFDKFDSTWKLHDPDHQMIHSPTPYNNEEMDPKYPIIGEKRKHPLHMESYFYRSAMSLGSIAFEATSAMAMAACEAHAPFNTGEWWLSIHHIPWVKYSPEKKYLSTKNIPKRTKWVYTLLPGARLKNRWIEWCGDHFESEKWDRDLFLFDKEQRLFYKINRDAPLDDFPKPEELNESFGQLILQVGSGLYGLREKREDGKIVIDWERYQKVTSFVRAVEIKLAQWAKQTWWILKASKNTHTISEIRGVHQGIDLISPNRFPFLQKGKEEEFFEFIEKASELSWGKPVGIKVVISNTENIEPFAKIMATLPKDKGPDFITVDGWDWWSWAAPIALWVLFWKKIYDALETVQTILKKYKVREKVKVFASSKLYAPHMSARAIALWADAIWNARSIMIAGWCIRAWLCSGEYGPCPIWMATMNKSKRRSYEQVWNKKVESMKKYIKAHNKWLIQVAAVAWVTSPHLLNPNHLVIKRFKKMDELIK